MTQTHIGGLYVGYCRVSTDKQQRSGLGLEAQQAAVAALILSRGGQLVATFIETESGCRDDRLQLATAMAECRRRGATLCIAKLDRLARSTRMLLTVIEGDVDVAFCDLPQIPPGPVGKFVLTLLASVAELEAGLIGERTRAALQAAKARGVKLGGPKIREARAKALSVRKARARQFAENTAPIIRQVQATGATTLRAIAAALTARGIKTASGCETWHPRQVSAVLQSADGAKEALAAAE